MATIWTLKHVSAGTATATTKSLGGDPTAGTGWGFHLAERTDRSFKADRVGLELIPDNFLDDTLPLSADWVYGDEITIYRDGVQWFVGTIDAETRSSTESDHVVGWTIAGPWQALEELIYYQSYGTTKSDGAATPASVVTFIERGDVTLMQRFVTGTNTVTAIKTGEQISDLLEFAAPLTGTAAIFQSAPHDDASPTILQGIDVDFIKARDETVANLIRKLVYWHPRATSRFDYTTSPPTLYIEEINVGATTAIDVDLNASGDDVEISYTPNPELTVPFVKIGYKTTNTVDIDGQSATYEDVIFDEYPADSTLAASGSFVANQRRGLRATVDLAGASASIQVQRVRTRHLPESSDDLSTDPGAAAPAAGEEPGGNGWNDKVRRFWSQPDRLPWLKDIVATGDVDSNIGVISHIVAKTGSEDLDAFPAGEEDPVYDLWDTPRVLDTGSTTADWMDVKSQQLTVSCKLIFKGVDKNDRKVRGYFDDAPDPDTGFPMVTASVTVTATNAVSKSYERTTASTAAETPPTGIAQKLFDDLAILKNTGSVRFDVDELPAAGTYYIGQPVDISDSGTPAWGEVNAQVQQVSYHLPTRAITLTIGAPKHLGLNDFITLARLWKANPPSFTSEDERKEGKPTGANKNKAIGGEASPKNDVDKRGVAKIPFVVSVSPDVSPGTGYKIFIEEGHVTTDRGVNGLTHVPPIMPDIGGTDLDDATRPKLSLAASSTTQIYAKHKFTSEGILSSVEFLSGALPADAGGLADPEHRLIATVTTDTYPKAATVIPEVEGSYHWASKFDPSADDGSGTSSLYTPPFHPVRVGNTLGYRLEWGVAMGPTGSDEMEDTGWSIFYPTMMGVELDHPLSIMQCDPGRINYFWMVIVYAEVRTSINSLWTDTGEVWMDIRYRLQYPPEIIRGPVGGNEPNIVTNETRVMPLGYVDLLNPAAPRVVSYWHGAVDITREGHAAPLAGTAEAANYMIYPA